MRRMLCLLGVLSLLPSSLTWAQVNGASPAKPVEDVRPMQLEIAILDVAADRTPGKPLKEDEQLARLERLETEGKLAGVQRIRLNLVANEPAQFQQGETVRLTVGRTMRPSDRDPSGRGGFGAGSFGDVTQAQQVGTLIRATARPVANGAVVELAVERSGATNPRPPAADGAPPESPKVNQLNVKTTLVLRDGERTIIASGTTSDADRPQEETWIVARVTVAPPQQAPAAAMIKIFHLKNVAADSTVTMIGTLFNRDDVRTVADPRTNTIIVASAPSDVLEQIEAILMKIDESPTAAAAPQVRKLVPIPEDSAPFFNPNQRNRKVPARDPEDDLNPGR